MELNSCKMVIIKKFAAIQISEKRTHDELKVKLAYGKISGPYYSQSPPSTEFDTEEEAIQNAYQQDKYAKWLIVPIIRFDNF